MKVSRISKLSLLLSKPPTTPPGVKAIELVSNNDLNFLAALFYEVLLILPALFFFLNEQHPSLLLQTCLKGQRVLEF